MVKKRLHHIWKIVSKLRSWYLVIGFIVLLTVTITSLRQNNLDALKLRDDVIQTDKQNGDVEAALRTLRLYVYRHMNTDLAGGPNAIRPPIQLKYRYERLVAAEKDRASSINSKVYTQAQAVCEQLFPHGLSGGGRVPCIQDYVTKHGVQENAVNDSLYKFDFASPVWSPDLAGFSLILTILLGLLLLLRVAAGYIIGAYLHDRIQL